MLSSFRAAIDNVLLPKTFQEKISLGDVTPESRINYRKEVDMFMALVLNEMPPEIPKLLSQTTPDLLNHYADRLYLVEQGLAQLARQSPAGEMPENFYDWLKLLLIRPVKS